MNDDPRPDPSRPTRADAQRSRRGIVVAGAGLLFGAIAAAIVVTAGLVWLTTSL